MTTIISRSIRMLLILISVNFISVSIWGQSSTYTLAPPINSNYIITITPKVESTDPSVNKNTFLSGSNDATQINASVDYIDGLGRPLQTIDVKASPSMNDIVNTKVYDTYGRESVKFLPYVKGDNNNGMPYVVSDETNNSLRKTLYSTNTGDGDYAYSTTIYDQSPLNRVLEQGSPGASWQPTDASGSSSGHSLKFEYEPSRNYSSLLTLNEDGIVPLYSTYDKYQKTIIKDENYSSGQLHTTEEYKDNEDHIVLKCSYATGSDGVTVGRLETHYIYDNFGHLRYVLPPKAMEQLYAAFSLAWIFPIYKDGSFVKDLCYYYEYDDRHRMTLKQIPGAEPVYMVYDDRDRLVLSQDGKMRAENPNKWMFNKYDALNRPVFTGEYIHSTALGQADMQTVIDNFYATTQGAKYYEEPGTSVHGYTNQSFPLVADENTYLTATYYDDYNVVNNWGSSYTYSAGYITTPMSIVRGQITGTKTKVLNSNIWIKAVSFYDDKYRVIQTRRDLYDGTNGGKEIASTLYDFVGKVKQTKQSQTFNGTTTTVEKWLTYDHAGRLTKTEQSVNGTKTTVSDLTYNEVGQLSNKKLGGSAQSIDYKYNIRGWLTQINDPGNMGSNLFGMKLLYNDNSAVSGLSTQNQFNGNISGVVVNRRNDANSTDNTTYAYGFTYDALNRLTSSNYGEGSGFSSSLGKYNESGISYDANGNICTLQRNNASGLIDNLSYTYKNGGNQLLSVNDATGNAAGFSDVNNGDDYNYDGNGNLTKDNNKGIGSISYNLLNLPDVLSKDGSNNIRYIYDATGAKLCKEATVAGATTKRYYCGAFEYDNNKTLSLLHTDEGIVEVSSSGSTPNYNYEYFLKDHLGNTRAVVNSSGSLLQRSDYYPFGMTAESYSNGTDNKYLYNGKEKQNELALDWYDYGARFYDPQIGRFTTLDPTPDVEDQESESPYGYVGNNPISRTDPDGRTWWDRVVGATLGTVDNVVGTDSRSLYDPTNANDYNDALDKADKTSMIAGVSMVVGGGTMVKGGLVTAAAGGSGLAVAGAGVLTAAEGGVMAANAARHLATGNHYGEATSTSKSEHGNKLNGKPAEGYTLRDKKTGEIKKYGETTRGEDKYGTGNQKRYSKSELKGNDVYYQKEKSGTKKEMHKWQHDKIIKHKNANEGKRPPLNKNDY